MPGKVHAKYHYKKVIFTNSFAVFTIKDSFRNAALNAVDRIIIDLGTGTLYFAYVHSTVHLPSDFLIFKILIASKTLMPSPLSCNKLKVTLTRT